MNVIDTKSDLAFKKVFGEKPHLLMSLFNNFLPLPHPEKIYGYELCVDNIRQYHTTIINTELDFVMKLKELT
jgi:hypothetical protein